MTPSEFYQQQLAKNKAQRSILLNRMRFLRIVRLVVFLVVSVCAYFFWGKNLLFGSTIGFGIIAFVYLVFRYTNVKVVKLRAETLIEINERELAVLKGDLTGLPTGEEFNDDQHEFSQDLDLFGESSFFQLLNRTQIADGSRKLAEKLTSNDVNQIVDKQDAVKELAQKAEWRQSFAAEGALLKSRVSASAVREWFDNYEAFIPSTMRIVVPVVGLLSLAAITLYFLEIISGSHLLIWFFVGGAIIGRYLKKIGKLATHLGEIHGVFQRYSSLLGHIETETFNSKLMRDQQEKVERDGHKASELLLEFSKLCTSLDQRNNVFISIPANGFFLRDLHITRKIELWISKNKDIVGEWFEVVAEFDALNSLGNYSFNNPSYVFPKIASNKAQMEAIELGHPLLKTTGRIDNDYKSNVEEFFIITGANMAGKSTFLRTVGLSLMMANNGLSVCAKSFSYTPVKLITSMRTTDSLSDNESYFFSELKRLKIIIDTIQVEDHFIILDEILKGTNSKDKAEGSQQFVQKLVKSKSTGIIATHDLSLCDLSASLDEVKNYYFDAEIVDDELFFDYRLKNGICQNMNASFLLRKMEIV